MAHGLSCPVACGIFPDQDLNLCPLHWGFPGASDGKESACNAGDLGSIPEFERSLGEGNGYPLQYSALENPMDCPMDCTILIKTFFLIIHKSH